jgi:hypothetical protein
LSARMLHAVPNLPAAPPKYTPALLALYKGAEIADSSDVAQATFQ